MAGTWIFLPLGGGGGGSAYFGDPVASVAALPAFGEIGEIRYVIDENNFYVYDGATWSIAGDFEYPITAGTTSQYWRGDKSWQDLTTDVLITSDGTSAAGSNELGEVISSVDPVALTSVGIGLTGEWGSAASLVVPAGTWALGGSAYVTQGTANLSELVQAAITTSVAPASVLRSETSSRAFLTTGNFEYSMELPTRVFNFAEATPVYINTKFTYDSGTPEHAGFITGWRIR